MEVVHFLRSSCRPKFRRDIIVIGVVLVVVEDQGSRLRNFKEIHPTNFASYGEALDYAILHAFSSH